MTETSVEELNSGNRESSFCQSLMRDWMDSVGNNKWILTRERKAVSTVASKFVVRKTMPWKYSSSRRKTWLIFVSIEHPWASRGELTGHKLVTVDVWRWALRHEDVGLCLAGLAILALHQLRWTYHLIELQHSIQLPFEILAWCSFRAQWRWYRVPRLVGSKEDVWFCRPLHTSINSSALGFDLDLPASANKVLPVPGGPLSRVTRPWPVKNFSSDFSDSKDRDYMHTFTHNNIIQPSLHLLMISHKGQYQIFLLFWINKMIVSFIVPGDWSDVVDIEAN